MKETVRTSYKHTLAACCIGYIVQAIANNFVPLLFLTLQREFFVSLEKITFIVTVNFFIQLLVDIVAIRYVRRIGYRKIVIAAHVFAAVGLAGLAFFPDLLLGWGADPYIGILIAVFLYAVGGGLIEVIISPMVEAIPAEEKAGNMSFLHSFYCWGVVGVVVLSTAFFAASGIGSWRILALLWAVVPLANTFYMALVPIRTMEEEAGSAVPVRKLLVSKAFWLIMLLMFTSGASELSVSQWASAYAEAGLGVEKSVGDLLGPCAFAVLMGTSRTIFARKSDRIPLLGYMIFSAVLAITGYLLIGAVNHPVVGLAGCALCGFAVGIFWPGTLSLAAKRLPEGGTPLFTLCALAGDLGCSLGPTVVGLASGQSAGNLSAGMLVSLIFPVVLLLALVVYRRGK